MTYEIMGEMPTQMPTMPLPAAKRPCLVLAASALALLLAGCGGGMGSGGNRLVTSTPPPRHGRPLPSTRQPVRTPPRAPQVQTASGLETVIGASRAQLEREFGPPRLDVWEGDARKLQFTGTACVLDIYLYPTAASREPVATYVETRRASDGQDVDRAACVAALKK